MHVTGGQGAPGFLLQKADWKQWQFHWAEWDVSAMSSGALLPATSSSPSFLGTYTGNFPNPIKTLSNPNLSFNYHTFREFNDFNDYEPGDIGDVYYYPYEEGPLQTTGYTTMRMQEIWNGWNEFKKVYDAFEITKTAYNIDKTNYNIDYDFTLKQRLDFFRNILETKKSVPVRPCKPTFPILFFGFNLVWDSTTVATFSAD
jgi:hypothetical protein